MFALMPLGFGSTIRANGHYLELLGGLGGLKPVAQPFLYLSDTEWLLNKYSDADIDTILSTRAQQGFTVIKIGATELNYGDTRPYDYWRPDFNNKRPFGDDNTNCTILIDDWWSRLRDIVTLADSYGLWVELTLGGPGRRDENPYQIHTAPQYWPATAYEYGYKVGQKFIDASNVIFNIGQDTGADTYQPASTYAPKGIGEAAWLAMAKGVADGYNGYGYNFCEPDDDSCYPTDYDNVTLTFHPGNPVAHLSSSYWFNDDIWQDFNAMQVNDPVYTYERVRDDYLFYLHDPPIKPTVFIEGGYEAFDSTWTPAKIRLQAWHAMFAGAAGYTYGHWENADPLQSHPPINPGHYIDADGAKQMAHLKCFLESYYWWTFVPDHYQSAIKAYGGSGITTLAGVKDPDGRKLYIYYPTRYPDGNPSHVPQIKLNSVRGTGPNNYYVQAKWFNPQTGHETTPIQYQYSGDPDESIAPEMPTSTTEEPWDDGVLIVRNIGS